jgi:ATP adenylyltransferase
MAEQRLWAPWRLEYIKSPKSGDCIFCTGPASGDDEAAHIVQRGERCFSMLNAYPYNNGHLMIAPYEHVPSLEDLDDETAFELMTLTRRSLAAIRSSYEPDGFNLGVNVGRIAGAGFAEHVHQHVVPRWAGDTNFMPVIASTGVLPESLDDSYKTLARALAP